MPNSSEGTSSPISMPKGGGAVKGIGETFQPNLFSGTGNFSIPIFTSPGRNGFGPQLTVQYSSGNGNGPFGLGWQISLPRITRKTEKGLPTYTDQDVFVMSGAEDLVPHLRKVSDSPVQWEPVVTVRGAFTISLYRPRTEGQFARIERWEASDGDVHWRATTRENTTSIYGRTATARIADPHNPDRVYEWLLEETFDAKGNHMLYEYVQEDAPPQLPGIHEHNRSYTQAYIRRILYGNTPEGLDAARRAGPIRTATDHADPLQTRERHYLFEVLFDYDLPPGDLTIAADSGHELEHSVPADWPVREDPFSTFRPGFEVRTLHRCRRVLMRHHFDEGELTGAPLVRSTDFLYTINPDTQLSFLSSATTSGYRKDPDDAQQYLQRDLPPVTFKYSAFEPQKQRYQSVTANGRNLPPRSVGAPDFTFMDVYGNGLPDILQDTGGGFHYWENLGQGQLDRRRPQAGAQPVHSFADASVSIADMGGDGLADLVVDAPPISGFYESTPDGQWKTFRRFETLPSFSLGDANTRLLDLTGDGLSDVLVTRGSHFLWYRCRGEAGYDQPRRVARKHDLDAFPDIYFDDPAGRVRLADMTGDGLNDIVLVHDGRIDYWPNLGYGRFGLRLTMANTPRIGHGYDPSRLFLADLDGSGCADLVYVEHCQVRFWFNQSGNAWSAQQTVDGTPAISDLTSVQFTDFFGTGTTTLLWSYDLGQHPGGSNYKVLDFCGGRKPNLLIEMDNNMGATTRVQYAASTKFYLEDKANGTPWRTSLPFPVQVLEKSEVIDHIGKTKLVTRYQYHHGYYDGREREFRGFGRVDQFDTETFDDFSAGSLHGDGVEFDNKQKGFHVPPVETRSWFHTGVYFDQNRQLDHRDLTEQYRGEYYSGDPEAFQLDPPAFEQPDGSDGIGDTPHEAYRALRGALLRTEVYARDDSGRSNHPYTVTETRYQVMALQPRDDNHHAVYLTTNAESLSTHYERNPADPRISHAITLGIDEFGNVTDSVAIGYPRRVVPADMPEQGTTQIAYTRVDFINRDTPPATGSPGFYYVGIPFQTRQYEITGIQQSRYSAEDFQQILDPSPAVDTSTFKPYQSVRADTDQDVQRRIIEWTRAYFRNPATPGLIDPIGSLEHRLPLGEIDPLALPYETYQAAFTQSLLAEIHGDRIAGIDLPREGGYHPHPNHPLAEGDGGIEDYLWIPSGRQGFDPAKFFQADQARDPFGNIATTDSDIYALLPETVRDALPAPLTNVVGARNDYRVLQPFEITDPNGNRSQAAFDALGLVVATAVMGTDAQGNPVGDSLDSLSADLSDDIRRRHIDDPLNLDAGQDSDPRNLLGSASTRLVYDLTRFAQTGQANVVYTLARETHASDEQGTPSKIQHAFTYSDGFGRESQSKVQAEPHPDTPNTPRWVGTGTIVYNNKGKAVQQYEPFFSAGHRHGIERHGVSPTLFYDPLGRVICTVHPNHSYQKVLFDPWQQTSWDSNDTVRLDPRFDLDVAHYVDDYFQQFDQEFLDQHGVPAQTWHQGRILGSDTAARTTAKQTEAHAATPGVAHLDSLGRPFLSIADNGPDEQGNEQKFPTRLVLDIEGNQRQVIDARGRVVMGYDFDMTRSDNDQDEEEDAANTPIHQTSMDAGERWFLNNAVGNPLRTWDNRGHALRTTYDELQRPTALLVTPENGAEAVAEQMRYGEGQPNAAALNLKGQIFSHHDSAGVVTNQQYDFKGNALSTTRQLLQIDVQPGPQPGLQPTVPTDWSLAPALETEVFSSQGRFDALNRPIALTTPHSPAMQMQPSIIRPGYNQANLLERVEANLHGATEPTLFVANIDYNAKGQRESMTCATQDGSNFTTRYQYEPDTFRLTKLHTERHGERHGDSSVLQDLNYHYDPVGNITEIRDHAQQTVFFANTQIEPHCAYTYDALYRLTRAEGREHAVQNNRQRDAERFEFIIGIPFANSPEALQRYVEDYAYDEVGNILSMAHSGGAALRWKRCYQYAQDSNRMLATGGANEFPNIATSCPQHHVSVPTLAQRYEYDAHGSITRMPHLPAMEWDFQDQLQLTRKQVVNPGNTPEQTRYRYDAAGERVRKVTERQNGTRKNERIYLGGFEIYREYNGVGTSKSLERETLHIMDDQQRIALVETKTPDSSEPNLTPSAVIRFQLGNHLGSAALELDADGAVITYEEYHPYGTSAYCSGRSVAEVSLKRYRYTGKERDEETGFSYHSARYYLPWLGRWGSADPAGLVDGGNLYRYAGVNPISLIDPNGTESKPKVDLSPIERKQGTSIPFESRHGQFVENVFWNISQGMSPSSAVIDAGTDGLFNKQEEATMSKFSPFEQLMNQQVSGEERHSIAWSGFVSKHGEVEAGRFFGRPGKGGLGFPSDPNQLRHVDSRTHPIDTRRGFNKKAWLDSYNAQAPLQGPGVVIGAPVYGVLRLAGVPEDKALRWAQIASSAAEIIAISRVKSVSIKRGGTVFNPDVYINPRGRPDLDIRNPHKPVPTQSSGDQRPTLLPGGIFRVPPPPRYPNPNPWFLRSDGTPLGKNVIRILGG